MLFINRGHAIITLFVESKVATEKEPPSEEKSYIKGKLRLGKIHLVDLASGERVSNTVAAGGELSEGLNINKSLLALSKFNIAHFERSFVISIATFRRCFSFAICSCKSIEEEKVSG